MHKKIDQAAGNTDLRTAPAAAVVALLPAKQAVRHLGHHGSFVDMPIAAISIGMAYIIDR